MTENNRAKGTKYEQMAADYLTEKEVEILCMNYRTRIGEIDIIAKDGKYIVFCEVKYRSNTKYGYPEEAVDYRKQNKIRSVARYYLMEKRYKDNTAIRFDVISILGKEIKHIKDAF